MAIHQDDIPGFFAVLSSLDPQEYLLAEYDFETYVDPRLAVGTMCSEMSTAQWKRPDRDEDLRNEFGAKAVSLKVLSDTTKSQSLNYHKNHDKFFQCKVTIAHPLKNFGSSISGMLAALMGEGALYCPHITRIKLTDIKYSPKFIESFSGPQFGIEGLRKEYDIHDRPFFLGVIKPNIGLSPKEMAELAYQSWLGGLDIAKDDEMLASPPWSPLKKRVISIGQALQKAKKVIRKKKIYVSNISDDIDQILGLHRAAEQGGANAIMINGFFSGLSSINLIRHKSKLPILAHFTGMALWERNPDCSIAEEVLIKIQRILGADMIVMPGLGERMGSNKDQVLKSVEACLCPLGSIKPCLPIPGGSDWAGTLEELFQTIGHTNFGFICGRGIFGHPQGPKAGAKSLHQAWDAISKEENLLEYAINHPELMSAIKYFTH